MEGGREYREGLLNASPFIDGDPRRPATTTMGRKGGQQVTPEYKHPRTVYKIHFSIVLKGKCGWRVLFSHYNHKQGNIQAGILNKQKQGKNRKTS